MATKNPKIQLSNQSFLSLVQDYLPTDTRMRELDLGGQPAQAVHPEHLAENTFYSFDGETASALCHGVEDLALEAAEGALLAVFPNFALFAPHRERYEHLAMTIDRVEVMSIGKVPKQARHITFVKTTNAPGQRFRLVLYQGSRVQALAVCRHMESGVPYEGAGHRGFYTFNAGLIARFQRNLSEILQGRCVELHEFSRLMAIDRAAKQLDQAFAREKEAMDLAVRRLRLDWDRYRAVHFASDFEKGLSRLGRWKTRLPEMLAQVDDTRP